MDLLQALEAWAEALINRAPQATVAAATADVHAAITGVQSDAKAEVTKIETSLKDEVKSIEVKV